VGTAVKQQECAQGKTSNYSQVGGWLIFRRVLAYSVLDVAGEECA